MTSDAERHPYDYEFSPDDSSAAATIVRYVPNGSRVLEIGCGYGSISRVLKEQDCAVTAVEVIPVMAQAASAYCERIIVADVEKDGVLDSLETRFDAIVMADVLEHLRNPVKLLQDIAQLVSPTGALVISFPNVAYFGLLCEVLLGDFRYRESGILDATHLRFFTWHSFERMLNSAGFEVTARTEIRAPFGHEDFQDHQTALPLPLVELLRANPELQVFQYVCTAMAVTTPEPFACADSVERERWNELVLKRFLSGGA